MEVCSQYSQIFRDSPTSRCSQTSRPVTKVCGGAERNRSSVGRHRDTLCRYLNIGRLYCSFQINVYIIISHKQSVLTEESLRKIFSDKSLPELAGRRLASADSRQKTASPTRNESPEKTLNTITETFNTTQCRPLAFSSRLQQGL